MPGRWAVAEVDAAVAVVATVLPEVEADVGIIPAASGVRAIAAPQRVKVWIFRTKIFRRLPNGAGSGIGFKCEFYALFFSRSWP